MQSSTLCGEPRHRRRHFPLSNSTIKTVSTVIQTAFCLEIATVKQSNGTRSSRSMPRAAVRARSVRLVVASLPVLAKRTSVGVGVSLSPPGLALEETKTAHDVRLGVAAAAPSIESRLVVARPSQATVRTQEACTAIACTHTLTVLLRPEYAEM